MYASFPVFHFGLNSYKYEDDFIIVERTNKSTVIFFTNSSGKILSGAFYENKNQIFKRNVKEL